MKTIAVILGCMFCLSCALIKPPSPMPGYMKCTPLKFTKQQRTVCEMIEDEQNYAICKTKGKVTAYCESVGKFEIQKLNKKNTRVEVE